MEERKRTVKGAGRGRVDTDVAPEDMQEVNNEQLTEEEVKNGNRLIQTGLK